MKAFVPSTDLSAVTRAYEHLSGLEDAMGRARGLVHALELLLEAHGGTGIEANAIQVLAAQVEDTICRAEEIGQAAQRELTPIANPAPAS